METDRKPTVSEAFTGLYGYNSMYEPMSVNLRERVALVTGASGVIGSAVARALARNGARVVVWDIDDEAGEEVISSIKSSGGFAEYRHVNLLSASEQQMAFENLLEQHGKLDILIANAGGNFGKRGSFVEYGEDSFGANLELNLNMSAVHLSQLALPYLIQTKGNIVFTSSVCGVVGLQNQCGFVAAKYAVSALARSLALEYGEYGVRVNALAPGSLPFPNEEINFLWASTSLEDYESNFYNPDTLVFNIPLRRPACPDDMTGIVLYLVSDDAAYTTGQVISVDGGWTSGLSGIY